tara:strand:- start:1121 stop:2410 length:1290 start_codon:yes stop_codon:yes gene_type:complete
MRSFLYQQKRKKNEKTITAKTWSCEIQLDGDPKPKRQSLKTTDKRVAQKRMNAIVARMEQERAGLLVPEALSASAQKPLNQHVMDFHSDLISTGRSSEYTRQVLSRLTRLINELNWSICRDLNADMFLEWRQKQDQLKPRTKSHFLDALNAFCNWMVDQNRLSHNPFERVKRIAIPKGSQGNHRSFSLDDLRRLMTAAPDRRFVYLLAVTTGLRYKELRRLRWSDVMLRNKPHLLIRAEATKSKRAETLWLTTEAAQLLGEHCPDNQSDDPVFATMPTPRTLNRDLERAGIPKHDHLGRSASFHTLRRSLVNILHGLGVDRRTTMAISRHTSSHLTDHIYADIEAMPTHDATMRIPNLLEYSTERTDMRTDDMDARSYSRSAGVASDEHADGLQSIENKAYRHAKTGSVASGQNPSGNGAGGNRTPVPG